MENCRNCGHVISEADTNISEENSAAFLIDVICARMCYGNGQFDKEPMEEEIKPCLYNPLQPSGYYMYHLL
jgi:hypothetical protein